MRQQLKLPLGDAIVIATDGDREVVRARVGAALAEHSRRQRGRVAVDSALLDWRNQGSR